MKTYVHYKQDGSVFAVTQSVAPEEGTTALEIDSSSLPSELLEFGMDCCKVKNGKLVVDNKKAAKLNAAIQDRNVLRNLIEEVSSLDLQAFLALPDEKKWKTVYSLLTAAQAHSQLKIPRAIDMEGGGTPSPEMVQVNPFPHGKPTELTKPAEFVMPPVQTPDKGLS